MSHGPGGDNPQTRGIAEFVAGLTYEQIPPEVVARIKLLILDSLGCAMFGTGLPWSQILLTTLAGLDTTTACAVWGTGRRLSAPHAALVNGTSTRNLDPSIFPVPIPFIDVSKRGDKNNFGPRAGLAWDVNGDGRLAVRSSYAINYDFPGSAAAQSAANVAPFSRPASA
jgi:hypothetical protein